MPPQSLIGDLYARDASGDFYARDAYPLCVHDRLGGGRRSSAQPHPEYILQFRIGLSHTVYRKSFRHTQGTPRLNSSARWGN